MYVSVLRLRLALALPDLLEYEVSDSLNNRSQHLDMRRQVVGVGDVAARVIKHSFDSQLVRANIWVRRDVDVGPSQSVRLERHATGFVDSGSDVINRSDGPVGGSALEAINRKRKHLTPACQHVPNVVGHRQGKR